MVAHTRSAYAFSLLSQHISLRSSAFLSLADGDGELRFMTTWWIVMRSPHDEDLLSQNWIHLQLLTNWILHTFNALNGLAITQPRNFSAMSICQLVFVIAAYLCSYTDNRILFCRSEKPKIRKVKFHLFKAFWFRCPTRDQMTKSNSKTQMNGTLCIQLNASKWETREKHCKTECDLVYSM